MSSPSKNPRYGTFAIALVSVCACTMQSHGQAIEEHAQGEAVAAESESNSIATVASAKEQKVKAAYIYNFSRYFEWPANAFENVKEPFVIGVLGTDPLGNQLDRLAAKKTVRKRKIEVQRFLSVEHYQECHVLFVTRSVTDDQYQQALQKANADHVLVVSEQPPLTRDGSSVRIFIDETGKVGFEIDVEVVNARSLQVNAKLLKLARVSSHGKK